MTVSLPTRPSPVQAPSLTRNATEACARPSQAGGQLEGGMYRNAVTKQRPSAAIAAFIRTTSTTNEPHKTLTLRVRP